MQHCQNNSQIQLKFSNIWSGYKKRHLWVLLISKKSLINSDHGAAEFFNVEQLFEAIQPRQFFNFSLPNGQDYSVFIAAWNQEKAFTTFLTAAERTMHIKHMQRERRMEHKNNVFPPQNVTFNCTLWQEITISELFKEKTSQCGNFMIFLTLRFYVKSIFGFLEVQNLPL